MSNNQTNDLIQRGSDAENFELPPGFNRRPTPPADLHRMSFRVGMIVCVKHTASAPWSSQDGRRPGDQFLEPAVVITEINAHDYNKGGLTYLVRLDERMNLPPFDGLTGLNVKHGLHKAGAYQLRRTLPSHEQLAGSAREFERLIDVNRWTYDDRSPENPLAKVSNPGDSEFGHTTRFVRSLPSDGLRQAIIKRLGIEGSWTNVMLINRAVDMGSTYTMDEYNDILIEVQGEIVFTTAVLPSERDPSNRRSALNTLLEWLDAPVAHS